MVAVARKVGENRCREILESRDVGEA